MSYSDFITEGGLIFNSVLAVLVAWIYWKQYRATSPSEVQKKIKDMEAAIQVLEKDSEKSLLVIESLKNGVYLIKDQLATLDRNNTNGLGNVRDEIVRMETRIDELYKNR